jgi:quinol monooxygenase YgiN
MELMGNGMATMTAVAKIRPEKRKEFLDVMQFIQAGKLKEKGLSASTWREDDQDSTCFHFVDHWETEADLKRYSLTDSFRVFRGALKTLCLNVDVKHGPLHGEARE